ncbi:MAG: hypothetical protein K2J74_03750, partial [Muribaculaceae bacterium]|nr:hypothetical protein [Muribaculaceae bacterium]
MQTVYDAKILARLLLEKLPYEANEEQVNLIAAISHFCAEPVGSGYPVFGLNGYAGTGKTSRVGALVAALAA